MPAAIDTQVKKQVINQWLSRDSRKRIAADNGIGAGTVSNIIIEWKKGVENSDYESIRELSLFSKKHGLNLGEYACSIRLNNYIVNIGTNPDEIESFIANLANSSEPANQIARVSRSESIPLADLEMHVKQREEEIQRLEEEINHRRTI
jgi:hypothetical protein